MRINSAKVQKKCFLRLKWLKIDGCMHPLLKIDGCSCTLCNRYYEGPDRIWLICLLDSKLFNQGFLVKCILNFSTRFFHHAKVSFKVLDFYQLLSQHMYTVTNAIKIKRSDHDLWSKMLIFKREFHKLRVLPYLCTNESFQMKYCIRIFLKGHANCQG